MTTGEVQEADRVTLTDVDAFLSSAHGQLAAKQALSHLNLSGTFDGYLLEQVALEAQKFLEAGRVIKSAAGWSTLRLRARALDLLRSPRIRRTDVTSDDALSVLAGDEGLDHAATIAAEMGTAALRRALLRAAEPPWAVSAAFTVVAVAFDDATPGERCPTPEGGASVNDTHCWVGLWYAGRQRCFEGHGLAEGAMRQHRSRDGRKVKELLQRVALSEGLGSHG